MKEISSCEICGNNELIPVLNLGTHPLCDDLVEIGSTRVCEEYPIEILFCNHCLTAHQRFQVRKETLFSDQYHYRSRFTADVLNGMKQLVQSCEDKFGNLKGKVVVDVGCNDGSLLKFFQQKGCNVIGVEPTSACAYAIENGISAYRDYFTEELAGKIIAQHSKADFITFTNVFAHIDDLPALLKAVKVLCHDDTIIVIENHYLGKVLSNCQFDTFYHEHPRTYSLTSFLNIVKSLGMELLDCEFPQRYGGNIRIYFGKRTPVCGHFKATLENENNFLKQFEEMNRRITRVKIENTRMIAKNVKKYGKLRAKAFPGRAAIILKLLNLDENQIATIYEKPGSMKIGHFAPGTRIEIHCDDELFAQEDLTQPIVNLAWHIPDEIESYLRGHHYTGEIIHILDFK